MLPTVETLAQLAGMGQPRFSLLLLSPAMFEKRKGGIKMGLVHRIHPDWKKVYISYSIEQDFETKTMVIMQKQYLQNVVRFSIA